MALALEFTAQLGKVVNLPVLRDPDRAFLVTHRHMAEGRQVEDGKAAAPKAHVRAIGK